MPAIHGDVSNVALQKLIDGVAASIRQPNGTILTAFKDRLGTTVGAEVPSDKQAALGKATEYSIKVKINPDGQSGYAEVIARTPLGVNSVKGDLDLVVLATKLV